MLLMSATWTAIQLLYDVTDPVRPRLLCKISNTSTHLFTQDTFEYLKPVSATETDVMLHSLGSGNESHAGKFPFNVTSGSWLADQTVMAYTMPQAPDNSNFPNGGTQVWLYAQRSTALLFTYRIGIGDCICRFGLPPQVLAVSPDGQYVVAGWIAGKGSEPLAVYRVSDRSKVTSFDPGVMGALWDRTGHRLFLTSFAPTPEQSWTPEAGVSNLTGAAAWSYAPGLSPDGSQVAFIAIAEGKQSIWVRPLGSLAARPLPGTEGATAPFWSPDNQYIGFFVGEKMFKVPTSGGPAQALCDMPGVTSSRSGTWNREGTIVFGGLGNPLYRVSEAGGQASPVTKLDQSRQETSHYSPHFLPDGNHFLYFARSTTAPANDGIFVGSLDSKPNKLLLQVDSEAQYTPPGYLLYVRDGTLTAQGFDANGLELSGEPSPVADQVESLQTGASAFSASENGVVVYQSGNQSSQLVFVDRGGKLVQSVGPPGEYRNATLSPDGSRVVVDRYSVGIRAGSRDLWLYELARGAVSRLTFDPSENSDAVWSPDGKQIVFESTRGGSRGLYKKLSSGAGAEETLFKASDLRAPRDWSSDGKFILFERSDPKTGSYLWVLPLFGDRKPIPFHQTEFQELDGRFSPNGRWIAYDSNESGKREVYVQPFPASAGKWQISTNGGSDPIWRPDGKELFYLATDGKIMAELVKADATFEAGVPKALFQTMFIGFVRGGFEHYRVTADGQRFLVNMPSAGGTPPPITVVLNWTAGLRK